MERLLSLILLCLVTVGVKSELKSVGRLVIRSSEHTDETISFMTDCSCNINDEMKFSVASNLFPNINDDENSVDMEFYGIASGCGDVGGSIQFNPQNETDITFKINRQCGVHLNGDKLPTYIAENFSGQKMEANIPIRYQGSSDKTNVLIAHLACVCEDAGPNESCQNDKIDFNHQFECTDVLKSSQKVSACSLDTNQLTDCGLQLTQLDQTITISGEVSLLSNNGRYDCPHIHEKDDYVNVNIPVNVDVVIPLTADQHGTLAGQYDVYQTCIKPAKWTQWSGWSACSVTCESGTRTRRRYCNNGAVGLPGCLEDDEEHKTCDADITNTECPKRCPDHTIPVINGICGCDKVVPNVESYSTQYVLFPTRLATTIISDMPRLTFNPSPDMEETVAIMYIDKSSEEQVNFRLPTLDGKVVWMFENHSPKVVKTMSNIGNRLIIDLSVEDPVNEESRLFTLILRTIHPIDLETMKFGSITKNRSPTELSKFKNEVISGVYHMVFKDSYVVTINDFHESVTTAMVYTQASDEPVEHVDFITRLDSSKYFCPSDVTSSPMPTSMEQPVPPCYTSLPGCDVPKCVPPVDKDTDDSDKEEDEDRCPTVDKTCDPTEQKNPCALGVHGTQIGGVSFSKPENCGECVKCTQKQVTCTNGVPEYSTIACKDCAACPDDIYNRAPFPQWQSWGACSATCNGGTQERIRDSIPSSKFLEISGLNVDCHIDFAKFKAINTETKPCNALCCGCCDAPIEDNCPSESELSCDNPFLPCTECNQIGNIVCTYPSGGCQKRCFHRQNCDAECCSGDATMEVENSRVCASDNNCLVGHWEWRVKSKCPNFGPWEEEHFGDSCDRPLGVACKCEKPKADKSEYHCIPTSTRCSADVANEFRTITEHCTLKNVSLVEFCHEYDADIPCVASVCDSGEDNDCCEWSCDGAVTCKVPTTCRNANGDEFAGDNFDCCKTKLECTEDQAKLCDVCNAEGARPPACLSVTNKLYCPSEDCVFPAYKCKDCQKTFCNYMSGENVKVVTITNDLLDNMYFDLPYSLYTPTIRFFIGHPNNFNIPECYHDFDRDDGTAVILQYPRSDLAKCGFTNIDTEFKATIYVDKSNAKSTEVSTHTPFALMDCTYDPTEVSATLEVIPRFDAAEFKGIIPGDVNITFDISTDKDFDVLLEDSDDLNAVIVGELLYARIVATKDFKITSCYMYDRNNATRRYKMLQDGCPADDHFRSIFKFKYIDTVQPFTTIFQWQNFIFREGEDGGQVLVYDCEVAPCFDNCIPTCDNRRRREIEDIKAPLMPMNDESDEPGNAEFLFNPTKFNFFLEVYNTRRDLEQALRSRNNDYGQELLITICSSVLVFGLALGATAYWISGYGKENNLDQKPYRADDFASLLRSMLDARFMRRRPSTPPPPYEDKEKNDFAKTVDQLIDSDPNFITKSLTPKIVIRNNNE